VKCHGFTGIGVAPEAFQGRIRPQNAVRDTLTVKLAHYSGSILLIDLQIYSTPHPYFLHNRCLQSTRPTGFKGSRRLSCPGGSSSNAEKVLQIAIRLQPGMKQMSTCSNRLSHNTKYREEVYLKNGAANGNDPVDTQLAGREIVINGGTMDQQTVNGHAMIGISNPLHTAGRVSQDFQRLARRHYPTY
jgi:hypothetical protein